MPVVVAPLTAKSYSVARPKNGLSVISFGSQEVASLWTVRLSPSATSFTLAYDDTSIAPLKVVVAVMVDEALEINPVFKLANPATLKVLEADKGPETFRDPE